MADPPAPASSPAPVPTEADAQQAVVKALAMTAAGAAGDPGGAFGKLYDGWILSSVTALTTGFAPPAALSDEDSDGDSDGDSGGS